MQRPPMLRLTCFQCPTRHQAEWQALTDEAQARVDEGKRTAAYAAGDAVFQAGELIRGLFCMHQGTVALRRTDEQGNSVLVKLAHHGQTFGVYEYFTNEEYLASAETLTDGVICFVDRAVLQELLLSHPPLGLAFMSHLARDLKQAHTAYLQMAALPVRQRLAHLLLALLPHFGQESGDGSLLVELPMTQQIVAELLGARRETIVRTFQALQEDGVVTYDGGRVTVPSLSRLHEEVEEA